MLAREMEARYFRWVFSLAVAAMFVTAFFPGEPITVGASAEWVNGEYHFAGGTNPWFLALGAAFLLLYLLLQYSSWPLGQQPVPGVFRRFVSFWLDLIFAILIGGPAVGIAPMLCEWHRTGDFTWTFERDAPMSYDRWVTGIGISFFFAWLAFYFAIPLVRRRPSPGACVMGYVVVADNGSGLTLRWALLRSLVGFFAVSMWPISAFLVRDRKKGKFWVDQIFSTHAVKLK
jgi:hypothetical protein